MWRLLKLFTGLGAVLLSGYPATAVADICDLLPGERPEEFTAKDICEVYEKPGGPPGATASPSSSAVPSSGAATRS